MFRITGFLSAIAVLISLAGLPAESRATLFVRMDEADLARVSVAAVRGTVRAIRTGGGKGRVPISTYVTISPSEVLFGSLPPGDVTLRELGGRLRDRGEIVHGGPDFSVGEEVIVFLRRNSDGTLSTTEMAMGKYGLRTDGRGGWIAVNDLGAAATVDRTTGRIVTTPPVGEKNAEEFCERLRGYGRGRGGGGDVVMTPPDAPSLLEGEAWDSFNLFSTPARYFEPDTGTTISYYVSATGDLSLGVGGTTTAVNSAFAAWSDVPNASIQITNAGACPALSACSGTISSRCPSVNWVDFDDPCGFIAAPTSCGGTLGMGGISYSLGQTKVVGGTTYYPIVRGWVVMNDGWGGCSFWNSCNVGEFLTHEVGHSIGFAHSSDLTAIMYPTAHGDNRCAVLSVDDIAGVTTVYPLVGPSLTPTHTSLPTVTRTVTNTLPPSTTPTQTGTRTSTLSSTPTRTPTPSSTPSQTRTASSTPTITNTPLPTNTQSPTGSPTSTPTRSNTRTPSSTPTDTIPPTPSRTPTITLTVPPTNTPSLSPTRTSTPTVTATRTPTNTHTGTPTRTSTRTATSTPTRTSTATGTPTQTRTPTRTGTSTVTPTGTPAPHDISGEVTYFNGQRPIDNVTANFSGVLATFDSTDSSGAYSVSDYPPGDVTIRPTRSGGLDGAVSALDASYVLQQVVGKRQFSSVQQLAADVSGDGAVTAIDASMIIRFLVGHIAQFPAATACASDWLFVPDPDVAANQTLVEPELVAGNCTHGSIAYSPVPSDLSAQNFVAILLGDPTGNWQPGGALQIPPQEIPAPRLRIGAARRMRSGRIRIPIAVESSRAFTSLYFEGTFGGAEVRRPRVHAAAGIVANARRSADGKIRVAVAAASPIRAGATILELDVAVPGSSGTSLPTLQISHAIVDETLVDVGLRRSGSRGRR